MLELIIASIQTMWDTHSQTYRLTHTNHKLVYAPAYHSNCNLCLSSSRSFLHSSSEFTYPSYHQNISSILDQHWKVDTRLFHQIWPCPGLSATFLISYTHFPESQLDCGSSKLKLLFCKDGKKYNLHMKAKASINACTKSAAINDYYPIRTALPKYTASW